jgi:feruloyl-CoA synthase
MDTPTLPSYRHFPFGVTRALLRRQGEHSYLHGDLLLQPYPERMTDRLHHWAERQPGKTLYAQRDPALGGDWRHLGYADALAAARGIGQALLERGLSAERPLMILSENSLDHAVLALGAMYAGVPFSAISPAYSLVSQDHGKLRHVVDTLTPGLVYAADWARYHRAIEAAVPPGTEVVLSHTDGSEAAAHPITTLQRLRATEPTPALDAAMRATGPDTIVKFLFTSGSTNLPKAVITTQRMLCANQQQILQSMPILGQEPPVLVDWMPWNHTAGGNHNFFMALYNGGSLYIDEGKPTPALLGQTLRNLREVAPTWYFNVPIGYEAIARAMDSDPVLRRNFYSRLSCQLYSGAALSQAIQDALYRHAEAETGERVVMTAGLGMTESSPFALLVTNPHSRAGDIGLPAAGLELKLTPVGEKTEIRYRGPNITPGYWRNPEATAAAFDEEGYFRTGDAVAWIDEDNIHLGLRFDGRTAEDFKLSTGTFVSVGPLRARVVGAAAPYLQDAVITGLNRNEVGALLIPSPALRRLVGADESMPLEAVATQPAVQAWMRQLLQTLAQHATGSANRLARAHLLAVPLSLDTGELTEKGSINQRAVLKHRAALVDAMHEGRLDHVARLDT